MSPCPHAKRRARPTPAICARASTITGSRSGSDVYLEPNLHVDHPGLSVAALSLAGAQLPVLPELFVLCAYRDRTLRSLARHLARRAPPPTLSSLQRGRLRPGAGQEND